MFGMPWGTFETLPREQRADMIGWFHAEQPKPEKPRGPKPPNPNRPRLR